MSELHPAAKADFNVTIGGMTGHLAVASWWADLVAEEPKARLWVQDTPYPCLTCCQGGSH